MPLATIIDGTTKAMWPRETLRNGYHQSVPPTTTVAGEDIPLCFITMHGQQEALHDLLSDGGRLGGYPGLAWHWSPLRTLAV